MSFKGLTTGVSGLQAQAKKMEVIGHNLANLNTAGFKRSTVTFHELFSDVIKGASAGDGSYLGGTNPMEIGGGVGLSAINKIFTQGARNSTGRTLDFMVMGDDFLVVQNGANGQLMLTRNGSFGTDGDNYLVDAFGNKVMGYTVDRQTQEVSNAAGSIQMDTSGIPPKATTELNWRGNIDPPALQTVARGGAYAWEVFSGGENFGNMSIATKGTGNAKIFGSGYYSDSVNYYDGAASLNAATTIVTLSGVPAGLVDGFQVGDTVSVVQGAYQAKGTISAVNTGTGAITLTSAIGGSFAAGAVEITNVSRGSSERGTSGATDAHADVLRNQIVMVDDDGKLIASFHRVDTTPQKYTRVSATDTAATTISVGQGEFTNMHELKELMESALRDTNLTNYASSTDLDVSIDKYGKITFGGSGLVQSFRLVINADNTEMLDRFSGIAMTDDASVATTQARVDANGEIIAPPALGLGTRATHASKDWFSVSGLENYGYSSSVPSTEFGEFAGLRLDSGATGQGYGVLQLSMVNALGNTVTQEFRLVQRNADPNQNEFSTMSELADLLRNTLRTDTYSTIASSGVLDADTSANVTYSGGRLVISTSTGSFRDLTIRPQNTSPDSGNGVNRTDEVNFGTVLGELYNGVNGKSGVSNQFIEADVKQQKTIYDNLGNAHTAVTYFVKDQSAGLTNIEWKFKMGLNPNLNTFVAENEGDNDVYGQTYNSLSDATGGYGVLAFDITTGDVLDSNSAGSDSRYSATATLEFTAQTDSQEADTSSITVDFNALTSFKGRNTIDGDMNGYTMGNFVRISTEENTGNINAVYSNGQVRTIAKIGLMHIANPEGLEKAGHSYFIQTPNSSAGGQAKGIDQVFAVGQIQGTSSDSVQSRVHGGSLEASNVDLTEELTDMIVTQRSYSASGKIITTSDEMLQEALNLKR
ncbi:MAG: flagellar hook-basal body complex protein [Chlamydiia bacterium]|nr:flagellar hook-basal body complex protein [Chlamydiia bacterium]